MGFNIVTLRRQKMLISTTITRQIHRICLDLLGSIQRYPRPPSSIMGKEWRGRRDWKGRGKYESLPPPTNYNRQQQILWVL